MSEVIALVCRKDKMRTYIRYVNQLSVCDAIYRFMEDDGRNRTEGEFTVSHHVQKCIF